MASIDFEKRVAQRLAIQVHMDKIGRKILVMSGKGGVGKTTVAVGLAKSLAQKGFKVGILDTDLHGPNVARMLDVDLAGKFHANENGMLEPVEVMPGLSIAGVDSAMEDAQDAVIWRGPMKTMVINDLLSRVDWGYLDFLFIDSPPGSGDEQLTVCKSIPELTGAIVVTTAQEVSILDAVRSVAFCRKMKIAILGLIENMGPLSCPHCGTTLEVFGSQHGIELSRKIDVPFLGTIPLAVHQSDGKGNPEQILRSLDHIADSLKVFTVSHNVTKKENGDG